MLGFLSPDLQSQMDFVDSQYYTDSPNQEMRDYLLKNDLINATRIFRNLLNDLEESEDSCDRITHLFDLADLFHLQDYIHSYIRTKTELIETIKQCHRDDLEVQTLLLASVYSNKGLGYLHLGMADSSHHYFQSAILLQDELIQQQYPNTITENHSDESAAVSNGMGWHQQYITDNKLKQSKAVYRGNLGRSQLVLGDTLAAIGSFQESISVNGTTGFQDGHAALISIRLANLFTEIGRLDEAKYYLDEASTLINRINPAYDGLLGHQRYQEALWKYYDKNGNIEKAYHAYRTYKELAQDQLNSKIQVQRLNVFAEYQMIKERQLANQYRASFQTIGLILFFCLVMLFILGLMSYLIAKNKNRVELHSKELESQHRVISLKNRQLKEAGEKVQQLTLTLAHDLRNPLTGIKMLSHFLLEEEKLSYQAEESISAIQLSCKQIGDLIDKVLLTDTAVFEKPPHFKMTNIKPFLKRCVTPMISQIQKKEQKLLFDCPDDIKAAIDTSKICRVIQNLTGNASKHNPEGTVIRVNASLRDMDTISLRISDNGSGIPQKELDGLFDFNLKLDESDNGEVHSFGLGLYIVQEIIQLHNGELAVESDRHGTIFTIFLPVYRNQTEITSNEFV